MLLFKTLSFSLVLLLQLQWHQATAQTVCPPQSTPFPTTSPSACASNPCQNCALCLSFPGQYVCICATGFAGTNCEIGVTPTTASTASTASTATTTTTTTTTTTQLPIPFRFCGRIFRTQKRAKRVVGGVEANPNSFPWQVNINDVCSGSLINKEWILTTASCLAKIRSYSFYVKLGQHDRSRNPNEPGVVAQVINMNYGTSVITHPQFSASTRTNDIALVRLSVPLALLTEIIVPICLPVLLQEFADGFSGFVTGWGQTNAQPYSCVLRQATVFTVNPSTCAQNYAGINTITSSMICAANPATGGDGCTGDGGGPLTFRGTDGAFYLGGLTSFGYGCGYSNYPGVYTKVSAFISWIESTPVGRNYNQ